MGDQANPRPDTGDSLHRSVCRGSLVIVDTGGTSSFAAVVVNVIDNLVQLTFLPAGRPEWVPIWDVSWVAKTEPLDPTCVPTVQPPPTVLPRRGPQWRKPPNRCSKAC